MKKDLGWLKEEVIKISENWTEDIRGDFARGLDRAVGHTIKLINQLDEPETLTQKWIDEHRKSYTMEDSVEITDLQNLLVPKQDELETKIKTLIEEYEKEEDAYSNPENGWISGFIEDLKNLVEEEQKYYVVDNEYIPLLQKGHGYVNRTSTGLSIFEKGRGNDQFALTEQEIKDYDPRYLAFKVPVEELEE